MRIDADGTHSRKKEERSHSQCNNNLTRRLPEQCERNDLFFFSLVTFRVRNQLFRVPREAFENNSEFFHDMFTKHRDSPGPHEGDNERNPIYLEGVDVDVFEGFLQVLFPRQLKKHEYARLKSLSTWVDVLDLAHKWRFKSIRELAISTLERNDWHEVNKLLVAHQYDIKNWYMPGYIALARRPEPLTIREAERLGVSLAAKIAQVRERRLTRALDPGDELLKKDIREIFGIGDAEPNIKKIFARLE